MKSCSITKGAAEDVFDVCTQVREGDQDLPFDAAQHDAAMAVYQALGGEGYRVLAVATKPIDGRTVSLAGR